MLAGALASIPAGGGPLHLQVSHEDDALVVAVVGSSTAPSTATYELEVDAGKPGSTNHSVQRGTARVTPGQPVTIARLRVGHSKAEVVTARLQVTPSDGKSYEESWSSPAAGE